MTREPNAAQPAGTRTRILDAAEKRLLARGPSGLVLDAVARDAGISKGGLLYHFPSKEALVEGLTERMLDEFDRVQDELAAADSQTRGRWARAYLASTVSPAGQPADQSARLMAGILAGLGGDAARLAGLHARFAAWHRRLGEDGADPVNAAIVRLAADGLWLSTLLGLPRSDADLERRVVEALRAMTR